MPGAGNAAYEELVTGAGAGAGTGAGAGALPLTTGAPPPELPEDAAAVPVAGASMMITRRLMIFRTSTCRGGGGLDACAFTAWSLPAASS